MLYSEQAGLEIVLQDKNLILPDVASRQSNVVLCIAPIWSDNAPLDEDEAATYDVITITKGEDFPLNGLGQYATTNPLARLWKQATDCGANVVKVVRLHGSTIEKRYMGLHNTLSMLSDYDAYDVVVIGGVYANDVLFEDFEGDAAALTLAKRNLLLSAYDVDNYIEETEFTETVNKHIDAVGTVAITFATVPTAGDKITVAEKEITFYADAAAKGADAYGVDLETDNTAAKVATAIKDDMDFGVKFTVTNLVEAQVLFTQAAAGVGNIDIAVGTGITHLSENETTPADIKYFVTKQFADTSTFSIATIAGIDPLTDLTYQLGDDGIAYVVIARTGVEVYPASIDVTYSYIEDPTTIDAIDTATLLVKKSNTTIALSDIGAGELVEVVGDTAVLDLTMIEDYANWNGSDISIKDFNGEDTLEGSQWEYDAGTDTITFLTTTSPANWSISFNIGSSMDFAAVMGANLDSINSKGKQVIGVMALKPATNNSLQGVKTYVLNAPFLQYSKYLQIVGGPEEVFQLNGKIYKSMWQGAYAGMVAVLPSYQSPLNKPIPGVIKQDYQLSSMQSLNLTNKHIIVSRKRGNYVVCSDAITTAEDTSDFVAITTIRVVNDAVNLVKDIAEPFIGQPNTIQMRSGLETSIKSGLEGMIKAGAITDFRFSIISTASEQLEGSMRIVLELIPVFTVRRIRVSVAVRSAL